MSCLVTKPAPCLKNVLDIVDEKGEIIKATLESYKKNKYMILFFYPFDFTFVCPTEIVEFDRQLSLFEAEDCQVIGCSADSAFSHKAWRNLPLQKGGIGEIKYPLIADFTKKVSEAYGVLLPDGMPLRGLFLIDKEGIVQHALINNLPLGRSIDEALRILQSLKLTEERGEVCPANWKKGNKSLKPTTEAISNFLNGKK